MSLDSRHSAYGAVFYFLLIAACIKLFCTFLIRCAGFITGFVFGHISGFRSGIFDTFSGSSSGIFSFIVDAGLLDHLY